MVKYESNSTKYCLRFLKRSEEIEFVELDYFKKWVEWITLLRWTLICKLEKYICWVREVLLLN